MAISKRAAAQTTRPHVTPHVTPPTPQQQPAKQSDAVYLKCATSGCPQCAQVVVRHKTLGEAIWLCGKCAKLLDARAGDEIERVGRATLLTPFERF